MGFSEIGAKPLLGSILLAIFLFSLLLEFTSKGAIVPYYIIGLLALIWFRDSLAQAMSFTGLSRDANLLIAFAVLSLAALHVHTVEVIWGLTKAAIDTAYQSGVYLGRATSGLF
jgi:hypothetical protein